MAFGASRRSRSGRSLWRTTSAVKPRGSRAASAPGQGEVAQAFELGEIEGQAVWLAETAQDTALQGDRLRLEESCISIDRWSSVRLRAAQGGERPDRRERHFRRRRPPRSRTGPDAAAGCNRAPGRAAARRVRDCGESAGLRLEASWRKDWPRECRYSLDLPAAGGEQRTDEARGSSSGGVRVRE